MSARICTHLRSTNQPQLEVLESRDCPSAPSLSALLDFPRHPALPGSVALVVPVGQLGSIPSRQIAADATQWDAANGRLGASAIHVIGNGLLDQAAITEASGGAEVIGALDPGVEITIVLVDELNVLTAAAQAARYAPVVIMPYGINARLADLGFFAPRGNLFATHVPAVYVASAGDSGVPLVPARYRGVLAAGDGQSYRGGWRPGIETPLGQVNVVANNQPASLNSTSLSADVVGAAAAEITAARDSPWDTAEFKAFLRSHAGSLDVARLVNAAAAGNPHFATQSAAQEVTLLRGLESQQASQGVTFASLLQQALRRGTVA